MRLGGKPPPAARPQFTVNALNGRAGADAYAAKPNEDGLLSVVNDLLKGKRLAGDAP